MKQRDLKLLGETFTHIDDVTGKQTTYCVYALAELCKRTAVPVPTPMESSDELANGVLIEQTLVPVEPHHAKYCVENRGVEEHRLARLFEDWRVSDSTGKSVVESMPIIFIKMPDSSMLLVDGTHRYVVAFMLKLPNVPGYFVPWQVAAPFIVEDAEQVDPEALLKSWSGL